MNAVRRTRKGFSFNAFQLLSGVPPGARRQSALKFALIPLTGVRLMPPNFFSNHRILMGQQLNKIVKRRRRLAYLKRKKELAKQGVTRKAARSAKAAADAEKKSAAKKPAAKKAVVKKAPAKKAEESAAPAAE